ncbi:hypothetical protein VP01_3713g1 [Puccinia sorghi]|uniref:Uncharacterized protein n=1 Tax=Puccinia sorghi TaxID=27349 RepID=A0A0L6UU73_9BASI|nr:hypothetical protein VP01_3713g1 [Puccinia sorghi]
MTSPGPPFMGTRQFLGPLAPKAVKLQKERKKKTKRVKRGRKMADNVVMSKDTTGMDNIACKYYKERKAKIANFFPFFLVMACCIQFQKVFYFFIFYFHFFSFNLILFFFYFFLINFIEGVQHQTHPLGIRDPPDIAALVWVVCGTKIPVGIGVCGINPNNATLGGRAIKTPKRGYQIPGGRISNLQTTSTSTPASATINETTKSLLPATLKLTKTIPNPPTKSPPKPPKYQKNEPQIHPSLPSPPNKTRITKQMKMMKKKDNRFNNWNLKMKMKMMETVALSFVCQHLQGLSTSPKMQCFLQSRNFDKRKICKCDRYVFIFFLFLVSLLIAIIK